MTSRAISTRAWLKRMYVRLVLSVIGLSLVTVTTYMVIAPQWTHHHTRRGIGGWICNHFRPLHGFGNGDENIRVGIWNVTRADLGFDITRAASHELGDTLVCSFTVALGGTDAGRWGITGRSFFVMCEWSEGCALDAGEREKLGYRALQPFLEDDACSSGDIARAVAAPGLAHGTHTVRSGYLLNAATLLGLAMFLCFAPLTARDAWRAWRYRRVGGCLSCGYDLRGLPDGAPVCPECGNALRTSR